MTGSTPVPRIVHQIWLQGEGAMPGEAYAASRTTCHVAKDAGWAYRLWSESDLMGFLSWYPSLRHLAPSAAFRADLGRYSILWDVGGLYLDMDIDLFRLPEDLKGAWTVQGGNHVMAAPPGHPRVRKMLEVFGEVMTGIPATDPRPSWNALYQRYFCADEGWDGIWPQHLWHDLLYGRGQRPSPARECFGHHHSRSKQWGSFATLPR